ncbi:PA14 domain-containing protein [Streptomyces sp. NBC_01474]|uniref:PA14 domain-containing protein n=1 Tax=Streptomyces TaxID=1883 RepID=UPI002DDAB437|nr:MULTISPECIES: PA14 domain-containing protein [unclassified Streptomyces]WSD97081.1 PA14 domain-containing protein [Streptomyces sp. NBC_01474]
MTSARPIAAATVIAATAGGLLCAVAPAADAAAVTCASPVFKREFFANTSFSGTPKRTDCDSKIDQDWGTGAPASGLPTNSFGVRWSVTRDFGSGGPFSFAAATRDGIRVYVDGVRKVDVWKNVSTTQSKTVNVTVPSGRHTLRVDFVNWTGAANVTFAYTPRTSASVDGTAPRTPSGTKVAYSTDTRKTAVSWGKNVEMDLGGYRVYRRPAASTTWTNISGDLTATSTAYSDTPPADGTKYFYRVRAIDKAANRSAATTEQGITTVDKLAPGAPGGLKATRIEGGAVRVDWQTATGAAAYQVLRSATAGGTYTAVSDWLTDPSFRDTPSFATTHRWYYRVVARDAAGNVSAPSATADTGAPDSTPPDQVQGVTADATTAGNSVSWQAGTDDTAHYEVWVTTPEGTDPAGPRIVLGTSYLDATAAVGVHTEYRVYAVDTDGNISPASEPTTAVRPAASALAAPGTPTALPLDSATRLSWPSADSIDYRVYRRTDPNGAWTLLTPRPVTALVFDDTTAPAGDSWYYVTTVDRDGVDSAPSDTAALQRRTPATPDAPAAPALTLSAPFTECTVNDCAGHGYGQDVTVTATPAAQPGHVAVGYRWVVSGPDGFVKNTTGPALTWRATAIGPYTVQAETSDAYGRYGRPATITFKVG